MTREPLLTLSLCNRLIDPLHHLKTLKGLFMPEFNRPIPLYLDVKKIHFEGVKKVGHFEHVGFSESEINRFLSNFSDFYNTEYLECKASVARMKLQVFLSDYGLSTSKEGVFSYSEPVVSGAFDSRSFQWFCFSSRKKLKPFCLLKRDLSSTRGFVLKSPKYQ